MMIVTTSVRDSEATQPLSLAKLPLPPNSELQPRKSVGASVRASAVPKLHEPLTSVPWYSCPFEFECLQGRLV